MNTEKLITSIADGTFLKTYTSIYVRAGIRILYLGLILWILFVIFSDVYIIQDPTTIYGMLTIVIFLFTIYK